MWKYLGELAITFLVLVFGLWALLLRPTLQVDNQSGGHKTIGMQIENGKQALVTACTYTALCLLALHFPPRTYMARAPDCYNVFLVLCYMLHHVYCYSHSVQSSLKLLKDPVLLRSESFVEVRAQLFRMFTMQLLSGLVVNLMLCYTLQRPRPQREVR